MRTFLYLIAKLLGDLTAVRKHRVKRRIKRRIAGRIASRILRRL